jgi:hypothetical protein
MTLPHLSTRSLVHVSLLASIAALVLSLARSPAPATPVHHALAAAPKAELVHTLTTRDPASARSYYLAQQPEDLTTYTHPVYGFSFPYFTDFTVREIEDEPHATASRGEQGELVVVENPAVGMGFQIFITPYDEIEPLTAARIRRDLPDMVMDEATEFTLLDETPAVRFVSHDSVLGDVGETWFARNGYLYELSVVAPDRELQDAWLRDIATHLTFAD